MKYGELHDNYLKITHEKYKLINELSHLSDGYISRKNISGKTYYCLQKRKNGKIESKYIKYKNLSDVNAQLKKRKQLQKQILDIEHEQEKIEKASKILSTSLYQKIWFDKQCILMDNMLEEERYTALEFSKAMTALEGIPVSEDTELSLSKWTRLEEKFTDGYTKILEDHNITEV